MTEPQTEPQTGSRRVVQDVLSDSDKLASALAALDFLELEWATWSSHLAEAACSRIRYSTSVRLAIGGDGRITAIECGRMPPLPTSAEPPEVD